MKCCTVLHRSLRIFIGVTFILVKTYREFLATKLVPDLYSLIISALRVDEANINERILRISKGSERRSKARCHAKLKESSEFMLK